MAEILVAVAEGSEVRQQVHMLLDRFERSDLLGQIVVRTGLLRQKDAVRKAETPKPCADAQGHGLAVGERRAVAIEEAVQKRQADCYRAAAEQALQSTTPMNSGH